MRAFVCGCLGTGLTGDERAFIRDADPWGLILFKRNVESREQLRALTSEFRACVGRDEAPVLIDQEGGRVQRLAPPRLGRLSRRRALRRRAGARARRGGGAADDAAHRP